MRVLAVLLLSLLAGAVQAADVSAACGPQTGVAAADRLANTLRWSTASEQDNFGYDVFRGPTEEGPFTKINKTTMLGHGTTSETHQYSYRDDAIDPCKAYWYYVESISTQGTRERFTPIARVKPKLPQDAPATAASTTSTAGSATPAD